MRREGAGLTWEVEMGIPGGKSGQGMGIPHAVSLQYQALRSVLSSSFIVLDNSMK